MSRVYRLVSVLVVLALLLSACQPVMPEAQSAPEAPHGLRPDAPPYAVRGPYAVGVRHFTIEPQQEADRELNLTVWYPALDPDGKEADNTYAMTVEPGAAALWSTHGHAVPDAGADSSGGPYPLVVYSHAHTGFAADLAYLVEHLTSYGFVVLAVDHQDNQMTTLGQKAWQTEYQRPDEIRRQIAYADSLTAGSGSLEGMIDTERIGVAGFSLGGGTALAAGGARLDLGSYRAFCESNPDVMKTYVLGADCVTVLDNEAELADLAGLEEVPAGLWPDWSEDRVDAVVAMGPTVEKFGTTGIQSVHVPTLLMIGSADTIVGTLYTQFSPYQHLETERKSEVVFDNSGHMLFFTACQDAPDLVDLGLSFYCSDAVWDMDRAHDLVNHFTTAFLLAELKGDADAAAALAPENVTFPGIQYETTAFAAPPTTETVTPLPNVAEIEALIQKAMVENEIPGMALGIVNGGEIAYTNSFGVERVGTETPVTLHSIFGTGSIGKTATATAIMQLVEQGKIDLDAPVTDYLPYFKLADERYKAITIRHLITHRSGLPEVEEWFPEPVEYDDGALERYVQSLSTVELLFAPGEQWSYSGNGFIVLADVVAKTSGQTFEEYLRDQIVDPLGMSDTLLIVQEAEQGLIVGNHVRNEQGEVVVSEIFPYRRQFAPTGPLNSSITDMTRYAAAQLGRGELDGTRILPAETYDLMWEKISDLDLDFGEVVTPLFANYGMGWTLGEIDGHRIAAHFGLDEGFSAAMLLAPDDDVAVVLISNYFDQEEFNLAVWEAAIETMRMMLEPGQ